MMNAASFYKLGTILETIDVYFYNQLLVFIDEHMEEICGLENLLSLDPRQFLLLTKRDSLYVSEFTLFKVSLEWSKRVCQRKGLQPTASNRRSVFEEFKSIRFEAMTKMEFDECSTSILALHLLTSEEILNIKGHIENRTTGITEDKEETAGKRRERYITFKQTKPLNKPFFMAPTMAPIMLPSRPLTKPPCLSPNKRLDLVCVTGVESQLTFRVTKNIKLLGMDFVGPCQIKLISGEDVMHQQNVKECRHRFFPSISLKPNQQYVLKVCNMHHQRELEIEIGQHNRYFEFENAPTAMLKIFFL